MFIAHLGIVLGHPWFNSYLACWVAPFFAVLVGSNLARTSNLKKYEMRVLLFGLASQPIYFALFGWLRPNFMLLIWLGMIIQRVEIKELFKNKSFFYYFYPLHLGFLLLFKWYLEISL